MMRTIVLVLLGFFVISSCTKDGSVEPINKDGVPVITFVNGDGLSVDPATENPSIEVSITCENKLSSVKIIRVDGSSTNTVWETTVFDDPKSYTYNAPVNINENTTGVTIEAVDIYDQTVKASIEITIKTEDPVGTEPIGTILAFPGAEGHGAYTTGGRGGKVYYVTTLSDVSTEGSLRYAINQEGARTILFKVSGTIALNSRLNISKGDVTIAGQSAPGEGICLRNYPLTISADNVIIRYIRSRMGNTNLVEDDAMNGRNQKNIIIDHCSMSWSIDEAASFYDNENFTMQWCMISESLYNSGHEKGAHGYGGIWGGMGASFHHNLLAHHTSRNPRFCGARYHIATAETEIVDFRNNVIYNWGYNSSYGGEYGNCNMVNNYYKAGPATSKHKDRIINPSDAADQAVISKWYVTGNYVDGYSAITTDNWNGGVQPDNSIALSTFKAETPFATGPIVTQTAQEAFVDVLAYVGAVYPKRDAIDARIVEEVKNGNASYGDSYGVNTGIIDTQESVGSWIDLSSVEAPLDTDKDGMPDAWEEANNLDLNVGSDGRIKPEGSDYTNLEIYLNSLVKSIGG